MKVERVGKNQKPEKKKQQLLLQQRLKKVRENLEKENLDAFLVSSTPNRFYLNGWYGDSESGFILITRQKSFILTDSRYTEHAVGETNGFEVVEYPSSVGAFFSDLSKKLKLKRVGFEAHDLTVFSFGRLKNFCKHLRFVPVAHMIEDLRSRKDETEIKKISKSVEIADKAFSHMLKFVRPGISEKEIAWEMEKFMREKGVEAMAWLPFIVASGSHSSMAHYGAGERKIKNKDTILLDYGCVWEGYYSDTSRVIFVGKPTEEQKKIYNLVLESQKLGQSLVRDGRTSQEIDKRVRYSLEEHTKHFYRHSLGHGIGLEVHELPHISINSKDKLQKGQVFTIEPGIYIPGWGGVRLEDIVVVTKGGCDVLTKAPKEIKYVTI